jgi:hypothetical protein
VSIGISIGQIAIVVTRNVADAVIWTGSDADQAQEGVIRYASGAANRLAPPDIMLSRCRHQFGQHFIAASQQRPYSVSLYSFG